MTSPPQTPAPLATLLTTMLHLPSTILSALRALLQKTRNIHKALFAFLFSFQTSGGSKLNGTTHTPSSRLLEYASEIETLFGKLEKDDELVKLSKGLQNQYLEALAGNEACMLPSYNHLLPSGKESGIYVALDVGGSTFRVAVLELHGRGAVSSSEAWTIMTLQSFPITESIKQLRGLAFFDWLAERLEGVLESTEGLEERCPISGKRGNMNMGLSWSFPIEHTSLRSGRIQGMGKGFRSMEGLLGAELADVVQGACDRRNLPLTLTATINDAAATLLSRSYNTPHTHYGLILGTGVNMGVHLPISLLASKIASRSSPTSSPPTTAPATTSPQTLTPPMTPPSSDSAELSRAEELASAEGADHTHVIVNTELSMFGTGLLPTNRFDQQLAAAHPMPDFQPLEMLVSGRYLGEIVRLVLIEAVEKAGLLGGQVPAILKRAYGLDTHVLAKIEEATTLEGVRKVCVEFVSDVTYEDEDLECIQRSVKAVSKRASACIATAVYALRSVRDGAESREYVGEEPKHETVACAGAVIQQYPGFMAATQGVLDRLYELDMKKEGRGKRVQLCIAHESSLLGAAVGAAVVAAAGEQA